MSEDYPEYPLVECDYCGSYYDTDRYNACPYCVEGTESNQLRMI